MNGIHGFASSRVATGLTARRLRRGAIALLVALAIPGVSRAGDATRGAAVFSAECSGCHSADPGKNRVGPSLFGVLGRAAGSVTDFAYSPAMRSCGLQWDETSLERYLGNPGATVPGIRMAYPGLHDATRRADLIAYLATRR